MRWCAGVAMIGLLSAASLMAQPKRDKPAVEAVQVEGTHLEQTSRCNKGGAIRVSATESRLLIVGDCTTVEISGSKNWVQVEHADRILMLGGLNTVLYQDSGTRVDDRGRGNSVAPKWAQ